MVISSPLVANILPIINLPMALGNLPTAATGLPLVPIGNDIQVCVFVCVCVCSCEIKSEYSKKSLIAPPPFLLVCWGKPSTKFQKGRTGSQFLEGVAGKKGGDFFQQREGEGRRVAVFTRKD